MNSEPPGILRYYQPEKATTSESGESKGAEKCNNKEQLQNPDEEMTQQDATEATAKSETVSKSVQVTSQKKESKRRRSSDKSTDLNERKKIIIAESSFVKDESSEEEHESPKNSGNQDFVSHPTNSSSLPSECFGQWTIDLKVFHSPGQTHFYSKEEQEVIEQAPVWAKLKYKEIKWQAVLYGQMKVQLTAFKAVVNQRLNEHEKAQAFINSRFEDIELQNDHLNRDMDVMRESVEDREEVIQQLVSRVDELEQRSRRECLVLNGVEENPHKTEDVDEIVLDVISQKLGVEISSNNDIQRCHWLKTRRPRLSPVDRQSPRPIIIKFVSYRKRQEVFTSKKKLACERLGG